MVALVTMMVGARGGVTLAPLAVLGAITTRAVVGTGTIRTIHRCSTTNPRFSTLAEQSSTAVTSSSLQTHLVLGFPRVEGGCLVNGTPRDLPHMIWTTPLGRMMRAHLYSCLARSGQHDPAGADARRCRHGISRHRLIDDDLRSSTVSQAAWFSP